MLNKNRRQIVDSMVIRDATAAFFLLLRYLICNLTLFHFIFFFFSVVDDLISCLEVVCNVCALPPHIISRQSTAAAGTT